MRALIAVDVQTGFKPGGNLAVTDGDSVVAPLVEAAKRVDYVVASRDLHPADHVSFTSQMPEDFERTGDDDDRYIWPDHCVAGTADAEMDPQIDQIANLIVSKGMDVDKDAYSAFNGTGLAKILRALNVDELVVGGLATDYCVKNTVLDALEHGFPVTVVSDACAAVDVNAGDGDAALAAMADAGARICTLAELETPTKVAV